MAALLWTCLERWRCVPEKLLLVPSMEVQRRWQAKRDPHLHIISEIVILFSICLLSNLAGIPRDITLNQVFITKSEDIISRLSFHSFFSTFSHGTSNWDSETELRILRLHIPLTITDHWSIIHLLPKSPLSWIGCAVRCPIAGGILCWVRLRNMRTNTTIWCTTGRVWQLLPLSLRFLMMANPHLLHGLPVRLRAGIFPWCIAWAKRIHFVKINAMFACRDFQVKARTYHTKHINTIIINHTKLYHTHYVTVVAQHFCCKSTILSPQLFLRNFCQTRLALTDLTLRPLQSTLNTLFLDDSYISNKLDTHTKSSLDIIRTY